MGNALSLSVHRLLAPKEYRVLLNGLDASGKTTVLYQWKLGEVVTTIPTIGFNVESVQLNRTTVLTAWDVGGRDKIRPLWRHYYQNTQGLLFCVDSNDVDRFPQAKDELHQLCNEEELRDIPLLVLCNKQDLPHAVSPKRLYEELDLGSIRNRCIRVVGTVATTGQGLDEVLRCLEDMLNGRDDSKDCVVVNDKENTSVEQKEEQKEEQEDEKDDEVQPPPLPDYPLTKGNPTLESFRPIQSGTECPFAKAAKLWGGNPSALKGELSLEEQAKANAEALTRFVYECQQGRNQRRLDGFCVELKDERATGALVHEFGECVRVFLTALSDLDPCKEFCLRKPYLGARGWRFRFAGLDFFVTSFAPCYSATSSRYAFGTIKAFVLLQPEVSFLHHNLPPDTAHTHWDQPQTVRDVARIAYKKAGRPYHIPPTTRYPPAEHIVKPLNDNGATVIRWWDRSAYATDRET